MSLRMPSFRHADLARYDTVILVASDWLGSAEAADARLLACYLVVRRALEAAAARPALIVETMGADNARLFAGSDAECLVSPVIQSNLLTQVALRRELHWVIEKIFGSDRVELVLHRPERALQAPSSPGFDALAARCAAGGEILLGVMRAGPHGRRAELNPYEREASLELGPEDTLIVLGSGWAARRSDADLPDRSGADQSQRLRRK